MHNVAFCRMGFSRLAHGRGSKGVHELTFQNVVLPATGGRGGNPIPWDYLHIGRNIYASPLHRIFLSSESRNNTTNPGDISGLLSGSRSSERAGPTSPHKRAYQRWFDGRVETQRTGLVRCPSQCMKAFTDSSRTSLNPSVLDTSDIPPICMVAHRRADVS